MTLGFAPGASIATSLRMSTDDQTTLTEFVDVEETGDDPPTPAENAEAIGRLVDIMQRQAESTGKILDRLDELETPTESIDRELTDAAERMTY